VIILLIFISLESYFSRDRFTMTPAASVSCQAKSEGSKPFRTLSRCNYLGYMSISELLPFSSLFFCGVCLIACQPTAALAALAPNLLQIVSIKLHDTLKPSCARFFSLAWMHRLSSLRTGIQVPWCDALNFIASVSVPLNHT
jgi:hypothetical protein